MKEPLHSFTDLPFYSGMHEDLSLKKVHPAGEKVETAEDR